ncbi:hypothetical protein [Halobiforma nitratireducens]|uniref:CHAT domain-containing protein n=1 Tax=Halobiforma nitratireducens JCM 10879 TaxID=1227454 RepID=M0LP58_9EURY|nr:hypothetical protein [Halobiforma nitratireducens]EMA35332.1 hypothetical protein C446_12749 [Halobiforma nitratireducens JCM 10879]
MIDFDATTNPPGIEVYDSIEQRRLRIGTGSTPSLPTDTDAATDDGTTLPAEFPFPVDTTCRIDTDELVFDQPYAVKLHDAEGVTVDILEMGETARIDEETKFLGVSGPIKLYFRIDASGTIKRQVTSLRISLEEETTTVVGARSLHDRPAGTITTTTDLESMLSAVSAAASALKTTSPERTWPTLRGHPPLIELGDRLEIPPEIEQQRPDSDVTIVIPPNRSALFSAASLAFFLGADVRTAELENGRDDAGEDIRAQAQPGTGTGPDERVSSEPALLTADLEYPLPAGDAFEDAVARLLKRFFLLDCLTRTEGIFRDDLHERAALEDELPFDIEELYDAPLSVRVERYLEVSYDRLEPHVPRWPLTAHVPAEPETVELLPFLINELGIVRTARGTERPAAGPGSDLEAASVPTPESDGQLARAATDGALTLDRAPNPTDDAPSLVEPDVTSESVEHAWFCDAIPRGASKATVEAYRNQLGRGSRKESIDILLVCNDVRMIEEHDLLDETYGNHERVPFDVDSEFGVDTDRLATLLTDEDYDFFHYIGHATPDGLRCSDGKLDVRDLESVDVSVFFLNACQSYEQGLAMTRRGAYGGVSTYSDVENELAVEAGETMARLLNQGFPLRGAVDIARENASLGDQYLIIGDGSTDIAQSDGGAPALIELDRRADGYAFAVQSYSTKEFRLGTATESTLPTVSDRHLGPGQTTFTEVDRQSLQEYFTWNEPPVRLNGELRWFHGVGSTPLE